MQGMSIMAEASKGGAPGRGKSTPTRGEVQKKEWKRSSIEELRKKAEEHCGKRVPQEAKLLDLG